MICGDTGKGYGKLEITSIITNAVENGLDEQERRNVDRTLIGLIVKLQRIRLRRYHWDADLESEDYLD